MIQPFPNMKTKRFLLAAVLLAAASMNADQAPADPLAAATAAFAKGDLATAETLAAPLAQGDTARAEACGLLAEIRVRQKRMKEAVELLEQAGKLDSQKPDYQSRLGAVISMRMGEVNFMQQGLLASRMLNAFKRSIELDPNHVPGYLGLARYYENAPAIAGGSLEKAAHYAEAVRKRDVFAGTLELGFIAERQDQPDSALNLFDEALLLRPDQAWLYEQTGSVLVKLGRPADARARFEKALALEPKRESARQAMAGLPPTP
jgi:tetratricopeptide (TPR) repeat protein